MNLIKIIEETFKNRVIIDGLIYPENKEDFEYYILDSLDKLNKQIEEGYNKKNKNGLQEIYFISINVDLYKKYKNLEVNLYDYTDFNNTQQKVKDCILLKNTALIDPISAKEIIYSYLN
jgi:hypothetical protein